VTASYPSDPDRYRLLANFVAGRSVGIAQARGGEPAHTDGHTIFVSADSTADDQRREVLVQSALLGAGSLDPRFVSRLRARPSLARRYLALEGHRVLAELGPRLPVAAALFTDSGVITAGSEHSLAIATSRTAVADPPLSFGVIKPSRLLQSAPGSGTKATNRDIRLQFDAGDHGEADDSDADDDRPSEKSLILKLFDFPVGAAATAKFLRKMFGSSRSAGNDSAGGELSIGARRRTAEVGAGARPLATPIRFTGDGRPGAAVGVGGALYPEWDVFQSRYRPEWCRVIDFPLTGAADVTDAGVPRDDVLRRRLSRVGLGPKVLRARADGDDLDTEALIDLFVDLRSGYTPAERIYTERRKLARNLGVLILLDASGSATDADPEGMAVHDHQCRAAATLATTLEDLGDRVAVYAFRSQGRRAVHLPAIKTFGQRFGVVGRARLNQLQPSGYTRLGAAIRGAGEILKSEAGTPNRLLLVLSDGHAYDDGYEGQYAEADVRKALEELRTDGLGCLCLSLGTATCVDSLERVFGSASHASATTLAELSPRMDELFMAALRELAAPKTMHR
jgi:nitric oxide reductase NorD protein